MQTKTKTKTERRLLIESKEGVDRIRKIIYEAAEERCRLVNAIHAVYPMESVAQCSSALRDTRKLWRDILKKYKPESAAFIDAMPNAPLEYFGTPPVLKQAEKILTKSSFLSCQYLRFNQAQDKWELDEQAALAEMNEEIDANQYRRYATKPYQFRRMQVAEMLASFLNDEKLIDNNVRQVFERVLSFNGQTKTWSMKPEWILEREGTMYHIPEYADRRRLEH